MITHRTGLMTQRTRRKNRIQRLVARLLIRPPCKVLWTKTRMAWLAPLELPPTTRLLLHSGVRRLAAVEKELASLDEQLIGIASAEPRVRLPMTLPGVSHVVAIGLLAALGDVHRFRDGDLAASSLGLAPITRQSGHHGYRGRIIKAGNSQAHWLLTESCQHVARHPGPLGACFRRLAKREKRQVAIVATARKLVTIACLMLRHNEPYRYAKPALMAEKFTALKRAPCGRTTKVRKLTASLRPSAQEGLAAGEQRMLKDRKLKDFVAELYSDVDLAR